MDKSEVNNSEAYQQLDDIISMEESLKERRDFKGAQNLYSQWITRYSKSEEVGTERKKQLALAFNNRGHLKYLEVNFDEALQDYNTALSYDPQLSSSHYNRGTILYRMGYFDKAIHDLRTATQLSPETAEFKKGLEQCQKELDKGS